jgi:transposase
MLQYAGARMAQHVCIQRRRGGGKANIALARKFLGVIYHTLKSNWVFQDFPNFVLASSKQTTTTA